MIKLDRVCKYYNTTNNVALGLHDVSLEFKAGEIVAITGESGSGKSTLLNVIAGVDSYEDGEMYFNGEETSYYNNEDLEKYRKDNVGFIFQNYNLVNSYTVLQNVMLPLLLRGYDKTSAKAKAKEIIGIVGLNNRLNHKGTHLSGGEAQRVSIARAIASDSPILACDEPTGNLDSKTGKEIIELIEKVSAGRLVLIVTHNYEEVEKIVTRRITLHDGEVVEDKALKETNTVQPDIKVIDYDIKAKDCIGLSIKNIFATPRKTIFTSIVFAAVAFIICSLIGLNSYVNNQADYSLFSYENCQTDRVIIYNEDGVDVDKVKDKYDNLDVVENSYLEDFFYSAYIDSTYYDVLTCYQEKPIESLLYGEKPKNENEVLLGIPKDEIRYYSELVGKKLDYTLSEIETGDFIVTGLFEYNTQTENIVVSYFNEEIRDSITTELYLNSNINDAFINSGKMKIYLDFSYDSTKKDTVVSLPSYLFDELSGKDIVVVTRGEEEVIIPKEKIKYVEKTDDSSIVVLGSNINYIINDDKQISVYASGNTTIDSITSYAKGQDYEVFVPSKIIRGFDFANIVSKIVIIISTLFIGLAIISLYFLSYLVLSRIYASKNRDYTIMRTLGVQKKEMSLVVYSEITILCASISILVFTILKILAACLSGEFWVVYRSMSFGSSVIFFIAILIFSLFMGRRFNKKLFKFSVNTTMKKEALDND